MTRPVLPALCLAALLPAGIIGANLIGGDDTITIASDGPPLAATVPDSLTLARPEVPENGTAPATQSPFPLGDWVARVETAAVRVAPPTTTAPVGLHGMPFAPAHLTGCDEMAWYREQAGLIAHFDGLGWRESNCRNDVSSYCCSGWFQLYVSLHLRDHRLAPLYAACDIDEADDVLGTDPIDKQRNACGAKAVYDVSGGDAWDAW